MKKLLITFVLSAFYATSAAAADFGVNVGVSGQAGVFTASATESTGTVAKGNGAEHGAAAYGSVFLEVSMADRFMLGVDYVPDALETDTVDGAMDEMIKKANGKRTIPQIFFDEQHIGGYDEVRALEKENKLQELLK